MLQYKQLQSIFLVAFVVTYFILVMQIKLHTAHGDR